MKKILVIFLFLAFSLMPVNAEEFKGSKAKMGTEFNFVNSETIIEFSSRENIRISPEVDIPPNAVIRAQTLQSQKEKRWHRSGYLICKLLDFTLEGITVDISKYEVYLVAKKYEPIDKKEAAILATELIVLTGASYFAPGVDVGYFFTKGAILRKKDKNWFKAGVKNAYDNSIFWFWLKGKPIDLALNDEIKLKYMERKKARNKSARIRYRKNKTAFRKEKKIVKSEVKEIKKEIKEEKKLAKEHEKMAQKMRENLEQRSETGNDEK